MLDVGRGEKKTTSRWREKEEDVIIEFNTVDFLMRQQLFENKI